jgi:DNA (cytosine-5)-methyltransferase 1
MNGLSLFSGIGGLDVALSGYVRAIAYCEIDPYCQGVLLSRIANGNLGNAPIWDDVRSLDGKEFLNSIDIIYAGFPCQDISIAANGKGLEGERSGLFFEIVRLSKDIKPKFIFLENVPAITTRGGLQVVREITEMGYDCRWYIISAASIGALHKRERWFLLANSRCKCKRSEDQSERTPFHTSRCGGFWETEPSVGRVVDGLPYRLERIRALGNSVVPQQAKEAFEILMGIKKENE